MSTSNRTRQACLLLCIALLAAPFLFGAAANAQSPASGNTSIAAAINSTASYINSINQSSYLIFYPNLTSAYNYLSLATNESHTNVTYSYLLLGKANESARHQAQLIFRYQQLSLLVLIALAILLAAILYFFMHPYRRGKRHVRHLSK